MKLYSILCSALAVNLVLSSRLCISRLFCPNLVKLPDHCQWDFFRCALVYMARVHYVFQSPAPIFDLQCRRRMLLDTFERCSVCAD